MGHPCPVLRYHQSLVFAPIRSMSKASPELQTPELGARFVRERASGCVLEPSLRAEDASGQNNITIAAMHPAPFLPLEYASGMTSITDRLFDELLATIVDGVPLPNAQVYRTAWRRDAAMVAMALEARGEVARIRDWILGLRDPYDRNNAGNAEPDNLGQTLYLVSRVADADHPAVSACVAEAQRLALEEGPVWSSPSDFAPHPVYQIKWLKFGLRALGLADDWAIPAVPDSYSQLFWMDFRESHLPTESFGLDRDYPYLSWAEAHFLGAPPPMELLSEGEWLTWEARASQADYSGLPEPVCRPHSWHAAEAFLYLTELES